MSPPRRHSDVPGPPCCTPGPAAPDSGAPRRILAHMEQGIFSLPVVKNNGAIWVSTRVYGTSSRSHSDATWEKSIPANPISTVTAWRSKCDGWYCRRAASRTSGVRESFPGNPHRHPVPRLEHSIVVHTPADQANQFLHKKSTFLQKNRVRDFRSMQEKTGAFSSSFQGKSNFLHFALDFVFALWYKNRRVWDIVRPLAGFVKKYFSRGPTPF